MPSFVCDVCQETIKKPKLESHFSKCRRASFSCIDCGTAFQGNGFKAHTSCISEAEKYEKSVYRGKKTQTVVSVKPEKRGAEDEKGNEPDSHKQRKISVEPKTIPIEQKPDTDPNVKTAFNVKDGFDCLKASKRLPMDLRKVVSLWKRKYAKGAADKTVSEKHLTRALLEKIQVSMDPTGKIALHLSV